MKYYNYHNVNTNELVKSTMKYFVGVLSPLFIGPNGPDFYICGGSILSYLTKTKINDIDLFFPNKNELLIAKQLLLDDGYECKFENDIVCNMHKGKVKAQLCKIKYGTVEEILESFDFVVCCAAINRNLFICNDKFWRDLHNKKLTFNNIDKPRNSLIRIPKYIKKGFTITYRTMHYLADALQKEVKTEKPSTLYFADGTERDDEQPLIEFNFGKTEIESNEYERKYS